MLRKIETLLRTDTPPRPFAESLCPRPFCFERSERANTMPKESVAASGFQWLSVVYEHVWRVKDLPFHHEDPFDRLLIAQADIEDLTFVTRDSRIKAYSIPLLDA